MSPRASFYRLPAVATSLASLAMAATFCLLLPAVLFAEVSPAVATPQQESAPLPAGPVAPVESDTTFLSGITASDETLPPPVMEIPKPAVIQGDGKIRFTGNKAFTEDQLEPSVDEISKDIRAKGLSLSRADDAAFYVALFYRKAGYSRAEVRPEITGGSLLLHIQEGPLTYLGQVDFRGNTVNNDNTLFQYLTGVAEESTGKDEAKIPFVEAEIQSGVDRIRGLYESQGRLDAIVEEAQITYSRDGSSAAVTVAIQEGPQYLAAPIIVTGRPEDVTQQALDAVLGMPTGTAFTLEKVAEGKRNLDSELKQHGYYDATVTASGDPLTFRTDAKGNRLVAVSYTLVPGAVYRFDGVRTAKPLPRLNPSFLATRFRSLSGEVYDPQKLDEKFQELLRTGLFSTFHVGVEKVKGDPDHVRIVVDAEEAKAKEVGFSLGFSSYEGVLIGLRLADRNIMGRGRPLSLNIDYSERTMKAELLYVDPWFLDSAFSFRARAFAESWNQEGYVSMQTGVRAELIRKINKNVEFGFFVQAKDVQITESAIVTSYLGPENYQIATIGLTQSFDYREESAVNPTKGWIITTGIDGDVVAGEISFGRVTARATKYFPIMRTMLLAIGARAGIITPLGEVPIDERYFLGGATTVRSFKERELGPRDPHDYPVGGEAFTNFNIELDFPIRGALHGAVFVDAGNVVSSYQNAGFEGMRYGVGTGLRYATPIGPVRLDVGLNPDPQGSETWGAVHFSFGFAF